MRHNRGNNTMRSPVTAAALFAIVLLQPTGVLAADLPARIAPVAPALAATNRPLFIEVHAGAAFSNFSELKFTNPIGTAFTLNSVVDDRIVLTDQRSSTESFTAAAGVGYFILPNVYGKVSYHYFGQHETSGFAAFRGGNFRQDLETTAHAFFVGLGATLDLTPSVFVEGLVEVGLSVLDSNGRQGANLGRDSRFPGNTSTDFAVGGTLGLGYRLTQSVDVILSGSYYWLGEARTGTTGSPPPAGMNPGERLGANVEVATIRLGGRFKF